MLFLLDHSCNVHITVRQTMSICTYWYKIFTHLWKLCKKENSYNRDYWHVQTKVQWLITLSVFEMSATSTHLSHNSVRNTLVSNHDAKRNWMIAQAKPIPFYHLPAFVIFQQTVPVLDCRFQTLIFLLVHKCLYELFSLLWARYYQLLLFSRANLCTWKHWVRTLSWHAQCTSVSWEPAHNHHLLQCQFSTLSLHTVELCCNIMKGTEYFVSLWISVLTMEAYNVMVNSDELNSTTNYLSLSEALYKPMLLLTWFNCTLKDACLTLQLHFKITEFLLLQCLLL
jgi:hypothetical protein